MICRNKRIFAFIPQTPNRPHAHAYPTSPQPTAKPLSTSSTLTRKMSNPLLTRYESIFSNLRTDKNRKKYTTGLAPHKATLLLSLLTLHQSDRIDLTNITITPNLLELWSALWSCLNYPRAGPIYMPLYHMKSDGFWTLKYSSEQRPTQVRSVPHYKRTVSSAALDPDLISLIQDPETRNALLNALLNGGYFSDDEIDRLKHKIKDMIHYAESVPPGCDSANIINWSNFDYRLSLPI